ARQVKELTRTNDMVRMSFLRALLTDAGIEFDVFDTNMNIAEGGNAVLLAPRLMVDSADYDRAKRLLREAGGDDGWDRARGHPRGRHPRGSHTRRPSRFAPTGGGISRGHRSRLPRCRRTCPRQGRRAGSWLRRGGCRALSRPASAGFAGSR